jgi:D-sedoheptulose 7-phosphate isomerase
MMQPNRQADISFDFYKFVENEMAEHHEVFEATARTIHRHFSNALAMIEVSICGGRKLMLFGDGGSAADAQHIAAELVIRCKADRPALAAVALSTDSSTLAACANDLGYDAVFARQIEALARPGDVALGISTSGNSANILAALQEAKRRGAATIGLSSGTGGSMAEFCDVVIAVPSRVPARIQEMHALIGHMLCKALEQRLGLI